ncbi:hypothetical protein FVER53590_25128 [Fusarium verticillioides]|nr:hypothetical protein FVER53590_25128 [Fusarium verticillioides]
MRQLSEPAGEADKPAVDSGEIKVSEVISLVHLNVISFGIPIRNTGCPFLFISLSSSEFFYTKNSYLPLVIERHHDFDKQLTLSRTLRLPPLAPILCEQS